MGDLSTVLLRARPRPPVVSPPPVLTSIASDTTITFNGHAWSSQSANKPDSMLASADFTTMVFRTRAGENYAGAGDTSRRVRSEIYSVDQHQAVGQTLHCSGKVRYSGPVLPVEWDSFVQMHSDDSLGVSPSFELCPLVLGSGTEHLVVQVNYRQNGGSTQYLNYYDTPVWVRDADHVFDLVFVDAYGGSNGRMLVTLDGRTVCDYTGPTGYYGAAPNSSYLKLGIHAGVDTEGQFPAGWNQTTTLQNVVVTVS